MAFSLRRGAALQAMSHLYEFFYIRHDLLVTKSVKIFAIDWNYREVINHYFRPTLSPSKCFLKSWFCVYASVVVQWECLVKFLFNLQ